MPGARAERTIATQKIIIHRDMIIVVPRNARLYACYSEIEASASISTSISGVTSALTATSEVAGQMSRKNSPCALPIFSQLLMSMTHILVRTMPLRPRRPFGARIRYSSRFAPLWVGVPNSNDLPQQLLTSTFLLLNFTYSQNYPFIPDPPCHPFPIQILEQGNRILSSHSGEFLESSNINFRRFCLVHRHLPPQTFQRVAMKDEVL